MSEGTRGTVDRKLDSILKQLTQYFAGPNSPRAGKNDVFAFQVDRDSRETWVLDADGFRLQDHLERPYTLALGGDAETMLNWFEASLDVENALTAGALRVAGRLEGFDALLELFNPISASPLASFVQGGAR